MKFSGYVKLAFLNQWNLLALGGGVALSVLSGLGGFFLPLILAGEIIYLAGLSCNSKFQLYVDSQEAKLARETGTTKAQQTYAKIVKSLPAASMARFHELQAQCTELQNLAADMRNPGSLSTSLEHTQIAGLDRLLWVHLRLLYTEHALNKFLDKSRELEINKSVKDLERRIAMLAPQSATDTEQSKRVRRTLEDNLVTTQARLTNMTKARENHELVQLELERLESKIRGLSELAVNRQEPDYITGQVDAVAESMVDTEQTMSEMSFVTGLAESDNEIPEFLRQTVTMN